MKMQSLPAALMAAVCCYAGVTYLWLWTRRRYERENLHFALSCLVIACYNVFCAGLYGAETPLEGMYWQRLQFAALAVFSITLTLFVHAYTGRGSRRAAALITLVMTAFFFLGLLLQGPLAFDPAQASPKIIDFGTLARVTYQETGLGPLFAAQYLCMMAGLAYLLALLAGQYRDDDPRRARPVLAAMTVFFAAAVNDVLVGAGMYHFIYCVEYAFMAVILSLSYALQSSFLDLHREVAELNRLLEDKVKERTMELLFSEIGREYTAKLFADASARGRRESVQASSGTVIRDLGIVADIDALLDRAVRTAAELSGAEQGHILIAGETGELLLRASYRDASSRTNHYDRALAERAFRENGPAMTQDGSSLAAAIAVDGRPAGVACFSKRAPAVFSPEEAQSLEAFIAQAALSLESAFLYQRMVNRIRVKAASVLSPELEGKMRKAASYLEENYREDVSREGLAASLSLHPDSLSRYFKRYTGKKIGDYVNEIRVRAAARLIRETDRNIVDIAFEVGFESVPTFNRVFQKVMKCPPSRMRE